jgi:hypothetical protein
LAQYRDAIDDGFRSAQPILRNLREGKYLPDRDRLD